ncbi:MAG: TIGR03862 family flavoprotein, partial [Rhodospirillales bacterium]
MSMDSTIARTRHVAVIGGGPAGLMAAEVIAGAGAGVVVTVFERMPSVGRKLLMAGRGGLNITHSEPFDNFLKNYGAAATWMEPLLEVFPPAALIAWYEGLGQQIFVGSSGRVFPRAMKASPLLRAWLGRLENLGVHLVSHASWTGWNTAGSLTFMDNSRGKVATFDAEAVVLALGGASWPRLGADGGWLDVLTDISIAPMRPANCGFAVDWSPMFRDRYAGTPLKNIALS